MLENFRNGVTLYRKTQIEDDFVYIKNFKKQKLEQRLFMYNTIFNKHPTKIPIIVDCESKLNLNKNKYIVPNTFEMSQFLFIIRKRLNMSPKDAIFVFIDSDTHGSKLITASTMLKEIYYKYKEEDNFLYLKVLKENTFGN